ncbi:IgGFc-binding protein-like [Lithobates pipiens]
MGSRLLLHICVLLCLGGGYVSAEDPGTDFAFVFMQNLSPDVGDPYLEVLLTAFFPDTQATIQLPNKNYSQVVSLAPKLRLAVALPVEAEILYSTRSNDIVRITSNKPISVVATNSKPSKTSVTVLTPIADWGTDYYVVTPDIGPEDSVQQMAIVNGPQSNFVSILLRATVAFEDTVYLAGEHLNLTLNPWETVHLQDYESLTGSHVLSQEPVALFSGRTCAEMRGRCQVYLQLTPVSAWGSKFVSPPLPLQKFPSKIYILAATKTEVNIVRGLNMTSSMMTPGVVEEFDLEPTTQLLILSPGKILVLLYVANGDTMFEPADGFLLNLVPREKACASYFIVWVPGYRHNLLVVAQEDGREGLQLNHEDLPQSLWKNIPGTDLSYMRLPLNGLSQYYSIYNPRHVFGVGTICTSRIGAYGAFGVCLDKVYNLCGFECSDELLCQQSACMSPEIQTCMAWGRTHMRTFRGTQHFQSGDCPLTLLASGGDSNFGSFRLERRADYQFTVKLEVFETKLVFSSKSQGTVLVNGEVMYTPIVLEDGKLNIITFDLYISVKTSFGLHVILGDLGIVHIQIPRLYSGILSGLCANQYPTEWSTFNQHNPLSGGTGDTNLNCNSGDLSPKLCENQDMSTHLALCLQMMTSDIFQACHSTLDPEPFVKACKFEVCLTGNVCLGLGAYALACDIERLDMTGWQSLTGCDRACPPNSYYSMCAPGCPATCDVNFSLACPVECQEGCVCNPGYILSDGGCVLEEECGCHVDGQVLKHGEAFYGNGCQVACTCIHGALACANHKCSAIEACQTIGGITACYPKPISCWVAGEKHRTFDGASFIANGECLYTMVTTECASSNITDLDVKFQLNSNRQLPNIMLKTRGHTIIIQEYSNDIEVDGITYTLPFDLENVIRVSRNHFRHNPYIRIEAEPGLILIVNLSTVWVNLPPVYAGNVCGLCGNANGDHTDDTEGWSPQDFLSNWTSHRDNNLCGASPEIFHSDVDPFNMTGGDVHPFNMTGGDVDPFNMTGGDVDPFNMTGGDVDPFNMTGGDVDPFNMTGGDVDPFNMTGGDVDPFNMTGGDVDPFNMTGGDVDPFNMTGGDVDPFNMTGGDVDPFNMTGGDVDPFNMTGGDVDPFNMTGGDVDPFNMTGGDVDPSNMTGGDVDPSNMTGGDVDPSNMTGGDVDPSNMTGGDVDPSNMTGGDVDPSNMTGGDVDPSNMTGGIVDLSALTALCDEVVMPEGAFQNCHDLVDPTWFFHTCLNYVSDGLVQSVCSTIKDYAFECQTMEVTVYQWEKETVCDHFGA